MKSDPPAAAAPPVAPLELPVELAGIALDPAQAARNKARRLTRLNTVTIPIYRFVGFLGLSVAIYIYCRFYEKQTNAVEVALTYAGLSTIYCLIALVTLRALYRPEARFDIAFGFLSFDVLLHILAIYMTGGENSWLVALLLLRNADQATSSQRRTLFFTHFNTLCFIALIVYLAYGEGRAIDWERELAKAVLLYVAGLWISLSAGGSDHRRRQVSAAIDVTRRMISQLESQAQHLDEAKALAESGNQAKSQFLANMSHELRTPLSGVVGVVDLLARENLSADRRQQVELLQASATSLLHIVDDILDFSRIEAGQLEVEERTTDLSEVTETVMQIMAPQAREQGVELSFDAASGIPQVVSDPARLRQILLNLVGNAIKFTPQGSVKVRLQALPSKDARTRIRIEVEDTGIGISKEQQSALFEPFTQGDPSLTREHGGTGLGLAIVHRLVELMGGTLGVESELDKGSVFWAELSLPTKRSFREASSEAFDLPRADGGKPHVLLVEDDAVNRAVAEALLQTLDVTVTTAVDGVEAVECMRQDAFDLVFMDCQMPNMDGYQATREIRESEQAASPFRHTPILALTAHALPEDRQRCLEAGMDEHLAKPVTFEMLARALDAYCPRELFAAREKNTSDAN